jgi:hypothetical protein
MHAGVWETSPVKEVGCYRPEGVFADNSPGHSSDGHKKEHCGQVRGPVPTRPVACTSGVTPSAIMMTLCLGKGYGEFATNINEF